MVPIMFFVIEHLEPKLSEWLLIEYEHAAKLAGRKNILITNVKKKPDRRKLSEFCEVESRSVAEIFPQGELVVLDPKARKKLTRKDLRGRRLAIGGILGDDPPKDRTKEMLTGKIPGVLSRNLRKGQLAIDGAVYLAKQVGRGRKLEEIQIQQSIEIPIGKNLSIILPFSYPLVKGKPLISDKIIGYLKRKGADF